MTIGLHSASTTRILRLFPMHLPEKKAASMLQLCLPVHSFLISALASKRQEFGVAVALTNGGTTYCPQLPQM